MIKSQGGAGGKEPPDDPHGIVARAKAVGINYPGVAAEFSRLTGIDHQRIEALLRSTRTGRTPHSHALAPVLAALEALEQGARGGTSRATQTQPAARVSPLKGNAIIYVIAATETGETLTRDTHSVVRAPDWLDAVSGVFGAAVRSNVMSPALRPGDRVVFNPAGIPQPGSIIALLGEDDAIRIREYVDETDTELIVRRYGNGGPKEEKIAKAETPRLLTVAAIFPGR